MRAAKHDELEDLIWTAADMGGLRYWRRGAQVYSDALKGAVLTLGNPVLRPIRARSARKVRHRIGETGGEKPGVYGAGWPVTGGVQTGAC